MPKIPHRLQIAKEGEIVPVSRQSGGVAPEKGVSRRAYGVLRFGDMGVPFNVHVPSVAVSPSGIAVPEPIGRRHNLAPALETPLLHLNAPRVSRHALTQQR